MDSSRSHSASPASPDEYGRAVKLCEVCGNEVQGPQCMFCGSKSFKIRSEKVVEAKAKPKVMWEGFLYKQGGAIKNWRRRYFALTETGQLSYHKTDQLHIKQLDEELGSLNVRGALIQTFDLGVHEDREGYVMGILPRQDTIKSNSSPNLAEGSDELQRQYLLEAPGYVDRQQWIDACLKFGAHLDSHVDFKRAHTLSIIEGFAWKKGGIRRNWKRRYFTLLKDPSVMTYVAKKGHPKLLGSIPVDKSTTVEIANEKGFILKIIPPVSARSTLGRGPRPFLLKLQDEKQRNQWYRAFGLLIDWLKNGKGSPSLSQEMADNPISSSGVYAIAEEKDHEAGSHLVDRGLDVSGAPEPSLIIPLQKAQQSQQKSASDALPPT